MNGLIILLKTADFSSSFPISIGSAKLLLNDFHVDNKPGFAKFIMDHNSESLFSTGVPVKQNLCLLFNLLIARVCIATGFFISWASSNITVCHRMFSKKFWSILSVA